MAGFIVMEINNYPSGSDSISTDTFERSSSSSDSSDDDSEFVELLILNLIGDYEYKFYNKVPVRISALSGQEFVSELLKESGTVCYELLRMEKACYINLCNELRNKNYLEDSREVFLEEQVAMFLFIIGHNVRHRVVADRFQHSTQTVSHYFKNVLRAICRLGKEIIKQDSTELPDHIKNNPKYYPWFKVSPFFVTCFVLYSILCYFLLSN